MVSRDNDAFGTTPETGYVMTADGAYIAYQVVGNDPVDLLWQPDWPGNIDMEWEFPGSRSFLATLASFSRVILHDHRGVGLSSRNVPIPNLETRVSDLVAVLDAVRSTRAVLVGALAAGATNALLAATRPERVEALVWLDPIPRSARAPDYPWGRTPDELSMELSHLVLWGTEAFGRAFADEQASLGNPIPEADAALYAKATRNACTPDVAIELQRMWAETDVRSVLPTIRVPTLCVAQTALNDLDRASYVASCIPGAEVREVSGTAWTPVATIGIAEEILRFIGLRRAPRELETVLTTVLFTDIVGSTENQARLGDRAWRSVIEQHHAVVRLALQRWEGREHDNAGDGFFATFDGPARAIRCAMEIAQEIRKLGIEVRVGVHTGECEVADGKFAGIAVSIGARIAAQAGASEVLVSQTVKDLVAGSRLVFEDVGEHELKGVSDRWRLYRVARA